MADAEQAVAAAHYRKDGLLNPNLGLSCEHPGQSPARVQ